MATACVDSTRLLVIDPTRRGYSAIYREGERNHCPGCGHSHWLVGRLMAECAFCATALPLEQSDRRPAPTPVFWTRGGRS